MEPNKLYEKQTKETLKKLHEYLAPRVGQTVVSKGEIKMKKLAAPLTEQALTKIGGLPSYLKKMTKKEFGMSKIMEWPKDKNLINRMEQWQAGRHDAGIFETRHPPLVSKKHADEIRQMHKTPSPKGSSGYIWEQARKKSRGE